jgi:hypothetical protein
VGVWAAGAGVPAVWGEGDDAEAGGSGAIYLLVSGMPALGGDGGDVCSGGTGAVGAAGEDWVLGVSVMRSLVCVRLLPLPKCRRLGFSLQDLVRSAVPKTVG